MKPLSDGFTLTGGINGIYSQSKGSGGQAAILVPATDGLRGRINLGLDYASDNGISSNIAVFYDGLGTSGYEAFGVNASMEFRF